MRAVSLTARRGDAGSHVIELQRLLAEDNVSPGPIDGAFGPATEAAVRVFQKRHGLTVDGVVGPATWRALLGEGGRAQLSDLPAGLTWGLDVSSDGQPRPLPWRELYEAGARFAWVRAYHGDDRDGWAAAHVHGAREAGLLVGAYGVLTSFGRGPAEEQGAAVATWAENQGALDLPVALDLELPGVSNLHRFTRGVLLGLLDAAAGWLGAAEALTERSAVVYTGPAWLAEVSRLVGGAGAPFWKRLAFSPGAGGPDVERPLWLAQYPLRDVQAGQWPAAPAPWSAVSCWQVSGDVGAEALRVDGRRVDLDLFRGTADDLRGMGR